MISSTIIIFMVSMLSLFIAVESAIPFRNATGYGPRTGGPRTGGPRTGGPRTGGPRKHRSLNEMETYDEDIFDLVLLGQTWPRSVNKFYSHREDWVISDLAPIQLNNTFPVNCHNIAERQSETWNNDKLDSIKYELRQRWFNPKLTNNQFRQLYPYWQQNWERHGTCGLNNLHMHSISKYFGTALSLAQNYNIKSALANQQIHAGRHYSIQTIEKGIPNAFGYNGFVICKNHNGREELEKIYLCFDKQFMLTDCGKLYGKQLNNCDSNKNIFYP